MLELKFNVILKYSAFTPAILKKIETITIYDVVMMGFQPGQTQTNLQPNFGFIKWRDCTIYVGKTKALISCMVIAYICKKQVFS